jgi:chromosome segregation ATPase
MANENKKINQLVTNQDDDPTAELEALPESAAAEIEAAPEVEAESEASTFDFDKLGNELGDADKTISRLRSDLKSRAESINKLQFDIEQLRSRWSGLEKEIEVREEITDKLTEELKTAHKKQAESDKRLQKRAKEIESLKKTLSDQEQSLQESEQRLEKYREQEQESECQVTAIQGTLDVAAKKIVLLAEESAAERTAKEGATEHVRALSDELDDFKKDLIESRASVSELQQYVDRRKFDWERQEAQRLENEERIDQLCKELEDANTRLRDGRTVQNDISVRLESIKAERDELLQEIARLRKDAEQEDIDRAEKNKALLSEQTGMLAGKDFQISELQSQIVRTETYADELRNKLQYQLSLTDELEGRQKHLEVSLADAKARIEELSNGMEKLRSNNERLVKDNSRLEKEFEKEVRQIRFELTEAQETIAENESVNEKLTSDLVDTGKISMSLEFKLNETEKENKATITKLNRKLNKLESLNKDLKHKLYNKNNAVTSLLNELTKRSEAIESIGEIENVIHDLDDRMSERIDDRGNIERERITRLLIGKIEGQKLRFPLFKNRLTIGRTGHNDIQLKAPYISRRHAVIVTDDEHTKIVDWGSKNGVFVNTNRVKEKILRNGDIVTIGTADFKFEERPKR